MTPSAASAADAPLTDTARARCQVLWHVLLKLILNVWVPKTRSAGGRYGG